MNLELKNVKVHQDVSEETTCFSATVYAAGKKVGVVSNDGRGGSHRYHWTDRDLGAKLEAWAETQPTEFEFEKLDQLVSDLVERAEVLKQLKRWTAKGTAFRLKGDAPGVWHICKVAFGPRVAAELRRRHGDALEMIANEDLAAACAV